MSNLFNPEVNVKYGKGLQGLLAENAPWRTRGVVVETGGRGLTSEDIIASPMNFEVAKMPFEYRNPTTGELAPYEDMVATYRTDTGEVLGHVKPTYEIVQIGEILSFFDSFMQDGIMRYEGIFSMNKGRKVVMQVRLPGMITPCEGDTTYKYLNCSGGFGGDDKIIFWATSFRTACLNSFTSSLAKADRYVTMKHTKNVRSRMESAKIYMSQFSDSFDLYEKQAAALAAKHRDNVNLHDFINAMFPKKDDATERQENNRKADIETFNKCLQKEDSLLLSAKGTLWSMFNGFTRYIDHCTSYNSKKGVDSTSAIVDRRFEDILLGGGADKKELALQVALSMAS